MSGIVRVSSKNRDDCEKKGQIHLLIAHKVIYTYKRKNRDRVLISLLLILRENHHTTWRAFRLSARIDNRDLDYHSNSARKMIILNDPMPFQIIEICNLQS